jgi:hypothetical protein
MATLIRAQVSIACDSAFPRDAAVNTWHFWSTSVDPVDDADSVHDALVTFYDTVGVLFSENLTGIWNAKYYNLVDIEPRTPMALGAGSFTPDPSTGFPSEVACCLSYRAAGASGASTKRRRGRIYLGPLSLSTAEAATGDTFIHPDTLDVIADAAVALISDLSSTGATWRVFSPTEAGAAPWSTGVLLASSHDVVAGYIDNAYDTVRSRGLDATSRRSWTS